jgi:hypothetical protein
LPVVVEGPVVVGAVVVEQATTDRRDFGAVNLHLELELLP